MGRPLWSSPPLPNIQKDIPSHRRQKNGTMKSLHLAVLKSEYDRWCDGNHDLTNRTQARQLSVIDARGEISSMSYSPALGLSEQ